MHTYYYYYTNLALWTKGHRLTSALWEKLGALTWPYLSCRFQLGERETAPCDELDVSEAEWACQTGFPVGQTRLARFPPQLPLQNTIKIALKFPAKSRNDPSSSEQFTHTQDIATYVHVCLQLPKGWQVDLCAGRNTWLQLRHCLLHSVVHIHINSTGDVLHTHIWMSIY